MRSCALEWVNESIGRLHGFIFKELLLLLCFLLLDLPFVCC